MTSPINELLDRLGDIPLSRVRLDSPPGTATLDDLIEANESIDGQICEWVDGTLVEKPLDFHASVVTAIVIGQFGCYLQDQDIGMCVGPDGVMEILPGLGRAPDVAFLSWPSLSGGKPPPRSDKVPAVVPDLAVEVLSKSNRPREMERKREEYFRAGVKLVWEIDPNTRSAKVYTSPTAAEPIPPDGMLDGSDLLPGFQLSLKAVFDRAERRK